MTDAFVVEICRRTAGLISSHRKMFRFHAWDRSMVSLDGLLFKSPEAAKFAAEKIAGQKLLYKEQPPLVALRKLW